MKHFGYEFVYGINNINPSKPLAQAIPEECNPVLERLLKDGHVTVKPDQLTVNQYTPGQGMNICYPIYCVFHSNMNLQSVIIIFHVHFCLFVGIPPHTDTHSACEDGIISVSLGSQVLKQESFKSQSSKIQ